MFGSRLLILLILRTTNALAYIKYSGGYGLQIAKRQDAPIAPDTASDCTWFETAIDSSIDCQYLEESYELTHEQFLDYNPSVLNDCSGIRIGNAYCVEVNHGLPRPTSVVTSKTSSLTPSSTSSTTPKPRPTQPGLIDSCMNFYFAVDNDRCDEIIAKFGTFTFEDFLEWNPAIGADCNGLWAKTYYCVGVPGTPTVRPSTTAASPTVSAKPSPTREGMIETCNMFHYVVEAETCDSIVSKYGTFTFQDFLQWNPAVGSDCKGLWLKTYFCVGVPGMSIPTRFTTVSSTTFATSTKPVTSTGFTTTLKPVSTTPTKTMTTSTYSYCPLEYQNGQYYCLSDPHSCNPSAPPDVQPSPICGCKRWHKVGGKDTCASIIQLYGITRSDLDKWNPSINNGGNCKTLWSGYNVCVGA